MRACVFSLLLSLLIAQQVTNVLKSAINRARPSHIQSVRMVRLQKANPEFLALFKKPIIYSERIDRVRGGPSFPSGHMTNNTVIADVPDDFLPAARRALLDSHRDRRLLAHLSWGALAERRYRNCLSRGGRNTAHYRCA